MSLLKAHYRAFVSVFCPECGWEITLTENQQGHCVNKRCGRNGILIVAQVKILEVKPLEDGFKRPANAPLKPI